MTRQEKKEALLEYRTVKLSIQRIREKLADFDSIPHSNLSGMPGGGQKSDPTAVKAIKLADADLAELRRLEAKLQWLDGVIANAPTERWRLVLCYRYKDGLTQEQTAEAIGMSDRAIRNMEDRAIDSLIFPDFLSNIQD